MGKNIFKLVSQSVVGRWTNKNDKKHSVREDWMHKNHLRSIQRKDNDRNGHSIVFLLDKKKFIGIR